MTTDLDLLKPPSSLITLSMVYPFGQVRLASSKHVSNVPEPDCEQSIRYESDPANFILVGVHPNIKIKTVMNKNTFLISATLVVNPVLFQQPLSLPV